MKAAFLKIWKIRVVEISSVSQRALCLLPSDASILILTSGLEKHNQSFVPPTLAQDRL